MVAYLRLLPLLGLLLADGTGVAAQSVQGVSKGQKSWTKESQSFFVPGAYIVEFEDENVFHSLLSPSYNAIDEYALRRFHYTAVQFLTYVCE